MVRPKYRKFVASKQAENLEAYAAREKWLAYGAAREKWLAWSEGSFYYDHYLAINGTEKAQAMVKGLKDDMDRLAKLVGVVT